MTKDYLALIADLKRFKHRHRNIKQSLAQLRKSQCNDKLHDLELYHRKKEVRLAQKLIINLEQIIKDKKDEITKRTDAKAQGLSQTEYAALWATESRKINLSVNYTT